MKVRTFRYSILDFNQPRTRFKSKPYKMHQLQNEISFIVTLKEFV